MFDSIGSPSCAALVVVLAFMLAFTTNSLERMLEMQMSCHALHFVFHNNRALGATAVPSSPLAPLSRTDFSVLATFQRNFIHFSWFVAVCHHTTPLRKFLTQTHCVGQSENG